MASKSSSSEDLKAEIARRMQDGRGCQYGKVPNAQNPHVSIPWHPEPKILDSVLDHIGNTPLVRMSRIAAAEGIECELLAKCEFFSAAGSVKDRIGYRMVEDAERSGRIKPGDTLIEPTSGNTGIGLALAAAVKGYRMIITLPEKMSKEKVDVLKALGAEIIRTPTSAAWDSPESHIGVAMKLEKEIPNSHILDQYSNPSNPMAHYEGTAEELVLATGGKIDVVVMTAGTGGTITGVARKLKEKIPGVRVVAVDPHGSILAEPPELNTQLRPYLVEGIGYDFIPKVLDRTVVDEWIKSDDKESFLTARRLIREEGLLCGGSSGAAMHGALQVAKRYKKGQRVVVLLADSVRNYMTKFLSDDWMVDNGFMEDVSKTPGSQSEALSRHTVSSLRLAAPVTVQPEVSCEECVKLFNKNGFDQMPVVAADGAVVGVVTLGNLTAQLLSGRAKPADHVGKVAYKQFRKVAPDTPLDKLSRIFERDHFALVVSTQVSHGADGATSEKSIVHGVATPIDVLNFAMSRQA